MLEAPIRATSLLKFATVSRDVNDVLEACIVLLDSAIVTNDKGGKELKFTKMGHGLGHAVDA